MIDHSTVYVAHMDSSIVYCGTKQECEDYRASMPYRTDCWKISTLEEYGEHCYSVGYDSGFDCGAQDGF